jgi:hypothetical protein
MARKEASTQKVASQILLLIGYNFIMKDKEKEAGVATQSDDVRLRSYVGIFSKLIYNEQKRTFTPFLVNRS